MALIDEGQYHDSAIHPGSMARRLLAAGVTLPPEPDTPPEAEERYYVGDGQSDNKVYERGRALLYAETYLTLDADRIARLLNLDESVKDDVEQAEACVARLRGKASARAVKATELALEDARAELIREREDRDLERDLFTARVKELEALIHGQQGGRMMMTASVTVECDGRDGDWDCEAEFHTGKPVHSNEVTEGPVEVLVPMPEGSYRATVTLERATWKRPRWPWPQVVHTFDLNVISRPGPDGPYVPDEVDGRRPSGYIPVPGKGENAWDCGGDGTFAMSGPGHTVEKAIATVVESVLRDRRRQGVPADYAEEIS